MRSLTGMIVLFSLLLTVLATPLPVSALMLGMSTEQLAKESDSVVTGRVEKVESYWSYNRKIILSQATVAVERQVRGLVLTDWITVEYPGGEVGEMGMGVSDMVPLKEGEDVLLFLKSGKTERYVPDSMDAASSPVFNIVGKAQGKYTIDASGVARKGGFSIEGSEQGVDRAMPLDNLILKIRKGE